MKSFSPTRGGRPMKSPKVGILTFSDGRPHVHEELLPLTK